MRLVFFGTGEFAVPALEALAEHVVLVVCQPDRPSGRGRQLLAPPVKEAAIALGLEVAQPEKARAPEFVESIEALEPDALVVASYGQILSQRMLDSARMGGINLHGSLLPKYRGAAPIQRCIQNGDTVTGITLMQMDRGMDTGDIIAQTKTPIDDDETYGELQDGLAHVAAQMARQWMPKIIAGDYTRFPQDNEEATMAPKITKEEAQLKFENPCGEEFNRYRAFTPSPGAFLKTRFGTVKLSKIAPSEGSGQPGTIVAPGVVAFGEGALRLLEIQPEGKKRMSGQDYMNGMRLKIGDSLINE